MKADKFYETKKEILAEMKKWPTVIIHRHERPDPDALGSQNGLAEIIRASFPDKKVFTAGENNLSLGYLNEMNEPADDDYKEALTIVVDTANQPRVDDKRALEIAGSLIKIDHHPDEDQYGDIQWVDASASSCSEMITDFWYTFQDELTLTAEAARLLYAGIVGDTNRFLYQATSPKTMRLAAELMEKEFSHTELNNHMIEMGPEVAKLTGYVLENLIVEDSGTAHIILTQGILDRFNITDENTHKIVPLPGQIRGVLNWGIFVQQLDGKYRARLRSKGPVINEIAKEHGGGGHPLASGANAEDEAEIKEIITKFEKVAIAYNEQKK